jgi:hypothetical protein
MRPAERGGSRRGSACSGVAASPAGQQMARWVGVEVQGGSGARKLAGGGSIPGVPRGGSHGDPADGQAPAEEERRAGFIDGEWERESLLRC